MREIRKSFPSYPVNVRPDDENKSEEQAKSDWKKIDKIAEEFGRFEFVGLPISDYHKDVNLANERTPLRPPIFIKALNEWIQNLCAQRRHTYLNYSAAMVDETGQMQSDLADDGLHPNSKGYRIMAPLAQDAILKAVTPRAAPATVPQPQKPSKRRTTSN